jgi:hypothetical protein
MLYDRIAHVFASLVYQSVGVFITAIMVMLTSIQHMKFYLCTGLGKSVGFMTAVLGIVLYKGSVNETRLLLLGGP